MSDSRRSNDSAMRVDRDFDKDVKPRLDNPPNSRLFIVCNKNITEEEFQEAFEKYGNIEEIWVVRDRTTRKPKGVTYIKFSKTSEAALALEEMNGRRIGNHTRALKVMIAHSRDQGSKREMNEEERLLRLFCVVPKTMTDSELREHFEQFGDIDYVSIVKDRETKESKGFAYVKYHRVSHAAKAFEGCDRSFKAVFAEPKRQQKTPFEQFDRFHGGSHGGPNIGFDSGFSSFNKSSTNLFGVSDSGGVPTTLRVIAASSLNQDQLWKLFDLIPGLDYLHLDPKAWMGKGQATVVYNSSQAASYAMEKLHGFEYPPGQRLIVKPDPDVQLPSRSNSRESFPGLTPARNNSGVPGTLPGGLQASSIASLAETLAQAQSLIQAAGLAKPGSPATTLLGGSSSVSGETYDPSYCSVKLPPPQPLAPIDSVTAERLFVVCNPGPPPSYAMRDVFGRFGSLIDVYLLAGKNYGYVKYANKESAESAIQTLHGQEICGSRLKVMPADPRTDDRRKRLRVDDP